MGLDTGWYCCQHLQSRPRRTYNTLYAPNLSRPEVPKGHLVALRDGAVGNIHTPSRSTTES